MRLLEPGVAKATADLDSLSAGCFDATTTWAYAERKRPAITAMRLRITPKVPVYLAAPCSVPSMYRATSAALARATSNSVPAYRSIACCTAEAAMSA